MAEALGIGYAFDQLVGEYSHGMRKRLQIAGALLSKPRILILDETFAGLDPEATTSLKRFLRQWAASGRSVLVSRALYDLDGSTIRKELSKIGMNIRKRRYGLPCSGDFDSQGSPLTKVTTVSLFDQTDL